MMRIRINCEPYVPKKIQLCLIFYEKTIVG